MASADATIRIAAHDNTKTAFNSVNNNLQKTNKAFSNFRGTLLRVAGVIGFGALVKSTLESSDKIQKLSIRLGVSTEALSEYQHVAALAGVEFGALTMSWQKMIKNVGDAASGTGEAKDALIALGVSVTDLNQMSVDKQFEALADAISKVESPVKKAQAAMDIFGTRGIEVIQMMEDGAAGMIIFREEAKALGLSLSRDAADQAANFNDELHKLKMSMRGLMLQVMPVLLPSIQGLASILKSTASVAAKVGFEIGVLVKALVAAFIASKLTMLMWGMVGALKAFRTAAALGAVAMLRLNAAMAKNVVGLVALIGVTAYEFYKSQKKAGEIVDVTTDAVGLQEGAVEELEDDLKSVIGWQKRWGKESKNNKKEIMALGNQIDDTTKELNANRKAYQQVTIATSDSWKQVRESKNWLNKEYAALILVKGGLIEKREGLREGIQWEIKHEQSITEVDQALLDYRKQLSNAMFDEHMQGIKLQELEKAYYKGRISIDVYKEGLSALGIAAVATVDIVKTSFQSMRDKLNDSWVTFWENTFLEGFTGKKIKIVAEFAKSVKKILIRMMAEVVADWVKRKLVMGFFKFLLGGPLAGIMSIFGFQRGGQFTVGGEGGKDNNLVAFNASRGETVSVKTPEQQKADTAVVLELRAIRNDLARVVAGPIVGAVTRGQFAAAGGVRH